MDLHAESHGNTFVTRSEVGSTRSRASSTASHVLLKQRAKTEAAKIRLQYACQEAKLMQEELNAQVRRKLLISECELKEAEVELQVLEDFDFEQKSDIQSVNPKRELSKCLEKDPIPKDELIEQYLCSNAVETTVSDDMQQNVNKAENKNPRVAVHEPTSIVSDSHYNRVLANHNQPALDIDAEEFVPRIYQPQTTPKRPVQDDILRLSPEPQKDYYNQASGSDYALREITKFMLRKDLVKHRLYKFTDSPGTFLIWKTTFKSVMTELGVNAAEETDLLLQYLGPTSSKYATTIRSANVYDPQKAFKGYGTDWRRNSVVRKSSTAT
jgi:hypothetical protein